MEDFLFMLFVYVDWFCYDKVLLKMFLSKNLVFVVGLL